MLEDALFYRSKGAQLDNMYIVKVADPSAASHRTYLTCSPPVIGKSDEEVVHHYWRADDPVMRSDGQPAIVEVLTASPLIVMHRLHCE